MKKDPFKTDKPLFDRSIKFDISHLPKDIIELIKLLEEYDKVGDWFNYDIKFDELEITAKSYVISNTISESDYNTILYKYGSLM